MGKAMKKKTKKLKHNMRSNFQGRFARSGVKANAHPS